MSFVVIVAGIALLLFAAAFVTKRRFGLLGLALAAGDIISMFWSHTISVALVDAGVILTKPPLESVVAVALILLPAFLVLAKGSTYHGAPIRLVGSIAFACLATAMVVSQLESALVIEGAGKVAYEVLMTYRPWIISVGLVLAVFDVLTMKAPHHLKSSAKH